MLHFLNFLTYNLNKIILKYFRYGRKLSIIIGSIIFIITAPLQAVVNDFLLYFFLRFLVGVSGIGAYNTAYTLRKYITTIIIKTINL